jgi:hypothetical protein
MPLPSKTLIKDFLTEFKEIAQEHGIDVIPTEKNRRETSMLGLLPNERSNIIMDLRLENYSEGPLRDDDGSPGDIYIFGSEYQRQLIYIKLKIDGLAKCLSFHRAEKPMSFPFR